MSSIYQQDPEIWAEPELESGAEPFLAFLCDHKGL